MTDFTNMTYQQMCEHDEEMFRIYLEKIKKEDSFIQYEELSSQDKTFFAFLNNGIGDHLAFKQLLPELFLTSDNLLIACVYPEVFWDVQNIQIISLEEGKKIIAERGETEKDYSVYEIMQNSEKEFRGKGNYILQAYKKLYL